MSITSQELDDENAVIITPGGRHAYGDEYKLMVFQLWYKLGKPGGNKLYENIEPDAITGGKPSIPLLRNWINAEFKQHAEFLDSQVVKELEEHMVAAKVEMLDRHANIGKDLQDKAIAYLDEHKDELKVPVAVKMLVEGVRIERESRGVASALQKMLEKSDDELMKEIMQIASKAPAEFEQIESEIDEDVQSI